jgi:hypothetical protein
MVYSVLYVETTNSCGEIDDALEILLFSKKEYTERVRTISRLRHLQKRSAILSDIE